MRKKERAELDLIASHAVALAEMKFGGASVEWGAEVEDIQLDGVNLLIAESISAIKGRISGRSQAAFQLRLRLQMLCARLANLELAAESFDPPEDELATEAARWRAELENGDRWDDDLDVVFEELGYLRCKLEEWSTLSLKDRERVRFVRAMLKKWNRTRRTGEGAAGPTLKAIAKDVSKGDFSCGTKGWDAISAALDTAARYGVDLGNMRAGPRRGTARTVRGVRS